MSSDDAFEKAVLSFTYRFCDAEYNEILAVSPPMSSIEKAHDAALTNAARQIALMSGLYIKTGYIDESFGRYLGTASDFVYSFNDSVIETIKSRIQVKRTIIRDGQVYLLVTDPHLSSEKRQSVIGFSASSFLRENNRPVWVTKPPSIRGYYVGVGIAPVHRFVCDSLFSADLDAAQNIVRQINSDVQNYTVTSNFENSRGSKTSLKEGSLIIAEGVLTDFYIIDRWYDPAGQYYYSLGIAKR
ncbi:LPP20 family lipoprotein [Brucepastera parasyntrophica]|uniref:LPP20 family lipoprotein n=1 Tax=Brucepastera parasyntrophica TaxID=2880008 RepID=UPI00210D42A2|nr:LPP20 family lipoprotein [Brucepastera parasyntrophica]ULQ59693.1 LPP20 family lipoprotein [Brucepastera parasyntrophica]